MLWLWLYPHTTPSICSIPSSHHWFGCHRLVHYNLYYNIIARFVITPFRTSNYNYTFSSGILGLGIAKSYNYLKLGWKVPMRPRWTI